MHTIFYGFLCYAFGMTWGSVVMTIEIPHFASMLHAGLANVRNDTEVGVVGKQ